MIRSALFAVTLSAAITPAFSADCPGAPADGQSKTMSMNMDNKATMTIGMAKDGTTKGDVAAAAAKAQTCMDKILKQEEQTMPAKPQG